MILRALKKRFLLRLICAVLIVAGVLHLIARPGYEEQTFTEKRLIMERSIRSAINRMECHHPELPIDNPEIMKFYKPVEKINCGNPLDDWVTCEKSICYVRPEISASYGDVTCSYTDLIRRNDFKVRYGSTVRTKEPYVLEATDFVKVVCRAENGKRWSGISAGIRDSLARKLENLNLPYIDSGWPQYNVLMLGFDSLSRNAFMRTLPKSYEYLTRKLGAIVLKGYNIVGDGTPQALTPILTGFNELELPDVRRRMPKSMYVNVYPMIWQDYQRLGYVTSFNEDMPNYGTFTYRLNGFAQQPVDHYMRTFYVEAESILGSSKKHCLGNQPAHMMMLNYTRNFMSKYSDKPRFVFSFHGDLSHDSVNMIAAIDDDLLQWFQLLQKKSLLENTILIVMSDHGNRFAAVRNTLQGKQEERLPFFSFTFPESFKRRFPREYQNFVENSKRLTTPFDIHKTLRHLLPLQLSDLPELANANDIKAQLAEFTEPNNKKEEPQRDISLFEHIPSNRSCADAYIEPHWCACLNWQPLDMNASFAFITAQKLSQSVINAINKYTSQFRHLCAELEVKQVNWAMRLQPHKELLRFQASRDADGFLADLSGKDQLHEEYYQIQLTATPGNGLFEASVQHDLRTSVTSTRISQISRINKYGSQANCIYDVNPELRKYCYCK